MTGVQLSAMLAQPHTGGFEKRLRTLVQERYLDRPARQARLREGPAGRLHGREPLAYAVGLRGGRYLAEVAGTDPAKSDWTRRNREIRHTQLEHALMVSEFRATLYAALTPGVGEWQPYYWNQGDKHRAVFFTGPDKALTKARLAYFPRLERTEQPKLRPGFTRHVVRPDAFFALKHGTKNLGAYYCLEADRSTMSRQRVLDKLRDYFRLWRTGHFQTSFHGVPHFVVLVVTKSAARRDSLRQVARQADDRQTGARLFRFATADEYDLARPESLLAPIWYDPVNKEPERLW